VHGAYHGGVDRTVIAIRPGLVKSVGVSGMRGQGFASKERIVRCDSVRCRIVVGPCHRVVHAYDYGDRIWIERKAGNRDGYTSRSMARRNERR
jgi:hypothetical protein